MSHIIRLNKAFTKPTSTQLKANADSLLETLKSIATIRAFYDFSNIDNLNVVDSKISKALDISGNNIHLTQANQANMPLFDDKALDGAGGAKFFGDQWLTSTDLIRDVNELTVAIFFKGDEGVVGNSIIFSTTASGSNNIYYRAGEIKAMSGRLSILENWASARKHNVVYSYNITDNVSHLYTDDKSVTGVTTATVEKGSVNIGRWGNNKDSSKFTGEIGHIAILEEDVSKNAALYNLLAEYSRVKYS